MSTTYFARPTYTTRLKNWRRRRKRSQWLERQIMGRSGVGEEYRLRSSYQAYQEAAAACSEAARLIAELGDGKAVAPSAKISGGFLAQADWQRLRELRELIQTDCTQLTRASNDIARSKKTEGGNAVATQATKRAETAGPLLRDDSVRGAGGNVRKSLGQPATAANAWHGRRV